jgi:phage shock protein PspC (stress-responsive transcriptional regulator)
MANWWISEASKTMKFELPPAMVRLVFVLGIVAAAGAVYAFAKGGRPIAIGLALLAVAAIAIASRQKQHL